MKIVDTRYTHHKNMNKKGNRVLKVLLLKGGYCLEREVSLSSAMDCSKALRKLGYEVVEYDLDHDLAKLINFVVKLKPDVVFNALHGGVGEDGSISSVFKQLNIPITHSSTITSSIGMDKYFCSLILGSYKINFSKNIKVANSTIISKDFCLKALLGNSLTFPLIIKPNNGGSTIDIYKVNDKDDFINNIKVKIINSKSEVDYWLIEEYLEGREFTVGVFQDKALAVTEINKQGKIYDYDLKYKSGRNAHICPALIPEKISNELKRLALLAHNSINCQTVSRSDFIWNKTDKNDNIYMLEINTHPGLTSVSLYPEQLEFLGISYEEMVLSLIKAGLDR